MTKTKRQVVIANLKRPVGGGATAHTTAEGGTPLAPAPKADNYDHGRLGPDSSSISDAEGEVEEDDDDDDCVHNNDKHYDDENDDSLGPDTSSISDAEEEGEVEVEDDDGKARRGVPYSEEATAPLEEWFISRAQYPYPNREQFIDLEEASGLTMTQIQRWFARRRFQEQVMRGADADDDAGDDDGDNARDDNRAKPVKVRKGAPLPPDATAPLQEWLISHSENPYPTDAEWIYLVKASGLDALQVQGWIKRHRVPSRHSQLKDQGLCVDCGKCSPVKDRTQCAKCQQVRKEEDMKRTAERIANGLCGDCGNGAPAKGYQKCQPCRDWDHDKYEQKKAKDARLFEILSVIEKTEQGGDIPLEVTEDPLFGKAMDLYDEEKKYLALLKDLQGRDPTPDEAKVLALYERRKCLHRLIHREYEEYCAANGGKEDEEWDKAHISKIADGIAAANLKQPILTEGNSVLVLTLGLLVSLNALIYFGLTGRHMAYGGNWEAYRFLLTGNPRLRTLKNEVISSLKTWRDEFGVRYQVIATSTNYKNIKNLEEEMQRRYDNYNYKGWRTVGAGSKTPGASGKRVFKLFLTYQVGLAGAIKSGELMYLKN